MSYNESEEGRAGLSWRRKVDGLRVMTQRESEVVMML